MSRINDEVEAPRPALAQPIDDTKYAERRDAFARGLAALMREHKITISSCGCCGGAGFSDLLSKYAPTESRLVDRDAEDLHETFTRLGENHL